MDTKLSTSPMWMTADQAAAYLGLPSRRALYMAIRRGHLPVHRLGRRIRFNSRELDDSLTGRDAVRLAR